MQILVDPEDAHYLQHRWTLKRKKRTCYAYRKVHGETLYLHRLIMGRSKGDGIEVDHVNGNGLDCRRHNMRNATRAQNAQNMHRRGKGVSWAAKDRRWVAQIKLNGKTVRRRGFKVYGEAIEAAKAWRLELMPFATN